MAAVLVMAALVAAGLWAAVCLEGHLGAGAGAGRAPVCRAARSRGNVHPRVTCSERCQSWAQAAGRE
jgi:hypothetical protein